jgi:P-type Ca2+ transporter type 2B
MEESHEKLKKEISDLFESCDKLSNELDILQKMEGVQGIARKLETDLNTGLNTKNEKDIEDRKLKYDDNVREKEEMPPFCDFVLEVLGDPVLIILIISAAIQIIIGASPLSENPRRDWLDGLGIVFAIVVVVSTASVTNYSKEKKFKEMTDKNNQMIKVVVKRDNSNKSISDEEILVGDIMKIEYGMLVPADSILISGSDVSIDESSLTGESDLLKKMPLNECLRANPNERKPSPLIFSGTTVYSGSGWCLVVAVGKNSVSGKIREVVKQAHNEDETKTPLELKLEDIADDIGKFGLYAAILTFVALTIKLVETRIEESFFQYQHGEHGNVIGNSTANGTKTNETHHSHHSFYTGISKEIISIVILCITIVVVAIPEGLPLAVTLSLSFSVQRMMTDNNLVRKMNACETMGGANFICTDKTGTLTKNEMTVLCLFDGQNKIDLSKIHLYEKDSNNLLLEDGSSFGIEKSYLDLLSEHICHNLEITLDENGKVQGGSKTDVAFYNLLLGLKINYVQKSKVVIKIPFSSDRKKLTHVISDSSFPTGLRTHMKGAAEIVLNSCSFFLAGGKKEKMTDKIKGDIHNIIKNYDNQCYRCIALAYNDISNSEVEGYNKTKNTAGLESTGFTLIAIAAIRDDLRVGVADAVTNCKKAGIRVIMVTGDNLDTAVAIAKASNIINSVNNTAMEGSEFITQIQGIYCVTCDENHERCKCPKTQEEAEKKGLKPDKIRKERIRNLNKFKQITQELCVVARARPLDKYALVLGLRQLDHVVAVTGDGTNDAPALSRSDVGFAMGIGGTDAAKNASDIIILDDNFSSIVQAVVWGRNIYPIPIICEFSISLSCIRMLMDWI